MRRMYGAGFDDGIGRQDGSGNVSWYGTDRMRSVRLVFDNSGTVTGTRDYSGFGAITSEVGAGLDRIAYTSREWDAVLGLQYNRARMYQVDTGTWTTEDPIGFAAGDPNLFRYVGNAVTMYTDPSGMQEPQQGYKKKIPYGGGLNLVDTDYFDRSFWTNNPNRLSDGDIDFIEFQYLYGRQEDLLRQVNRLLEKLEKQRVGFSDEIGRLNGLARQSDPDNGYIGDQDFVNAREEFYAIRRSVRLSLDVRESVRTGAEIVSYGDPTPLSSVVQGVIEASGDRPELDASATIVSAIIPGVFKRFGKSVFKNVVKSADDAPSPSMALAYLDSLVEGSNRLGKPLERQKLLQLKDRLWRDFKVVLSPGSAADLPGKTRAKFRITINPQGNVVGEPQIFFREGEATYGDIQHELFHMLHANKIGNKEYAALVKLNPLATEQFVYDNMIKQHVWDKLSPKEQQNAIDYIHWVHGGDTRCKTHSPTNPFEN